MVHKSNFINVIRIIKKRLWIIIVGGFLGVAIASAITFFVMPPVYSSSTQLIVNANSAEDPGANLQTNVNGNVLMINTYKDMILGDLVLEAVSDELEETYQYRISIDELHQCLAINQSEDSQIFRIVATAEKPRDAAMVANTTAAVFQEKAQEILKVSTVTITSKGRVPQNPISPNRKLNILLGLITGLMFGSAFCFLLELIDKTVKDQWYVEEYLGIPILGETSELSKKDLTASKKVSLRKTRKMSRS
ncbi:YveK family protein [Enterococcus sp. AZ109]|uniref:YveK family protein n=1 Tax=Enterococcus sp. AZ109 TaxID=2774634 RepID=UPI003F1EC961